MMSAWPHFSARHIGSMRHRIGGVYAWPGRRSAIAGPSCRRRPSQGVLPGSVQIPPDGQPIILGWDGPVTGGYPVIAGVITADVPRLAQLKPGDAVRFVTIEVEAACELAAAQWTFKELA